MDCIKLSLLTCILKFSDYLSSEYRLNNRDIWPQEATIIEDPLTGLFKFITENYQKHRFT